MIKIKKIKKYYGNKLVLNIAELNIRKNQIFGIVGGNGSGKTTLLKILSDLESSDSGEFEIFVKSNEHVYLFQKPLLFNTSVYNNIAYPLKFRKVDKLEIHKRVENILKEFGIYDLKDQNALKLSGGESQKVNLARALIFNPKLIFLDEPTANTDPASTKKIEEILLKALENNMSIVLVTHNIAQAKRLCKTVCVMNEGRVIKIGKSKEILDSEELQYI